MYKIFRQPGIQLKTLHKTHISYRIEPKLFPTLPARHLDKKYPTNNETSQK